MEAHRPTMDDVKRMYERYEEARRFVAEFEEWVTRAPGEGDKPARGPFSGLQQREAVMEILEEHPEKAFLTREIVALLVEGGMLFQTQTPVTSISSILSKAADEGVVNRVERGRWSIKGHPPKPRPKPKRPEPRPKPKRRVLEPDDDLPF